MDASLASNPNNLRKPPQPPPVVLRGGGGGCNLRIKLTSKHLFENLTQLDFVALT
jgi:hypothetical protein